MATSGERGRIHEGAAQIGHRMRHYLATRAWDYMSRKEGFVLSDESRKNLAEADERLNNEAVVFFANHTKKKDVAILGSLGFSHLSNIQTVIVPVGMKHYDIKRDPASAVLYRVILEPLGASLYPIVQEGDEGSYTEEERRIKIATLKDKAQSVLNLPHAAYAILPEGTRGKEGEEATLTRAGRGIGNLEKYNPELSYCPIAVIYKKFSDKPELIVGKTYRLKDIVPAGVALPDLSDEIDAKVKAEYYKARAQYYADLHMQVVARMLPEHMQGVYKDLVLEPPVIPTL